MVEVMANKFYIEYPLHLDVNFDQLIYLNCLLV